MIFGTLDKDSLKSLLDLSGREKALLYPLLVLTIFFGVYPAPVFGRDGSLGGRAYQQLHCGRAGSA
ncbi:hypothetical protein LP421_10850 [Rhizobium sp. RCAM05350]|nr:hypothetical protein LP421_10850 [Rhizobium sp. RCAM05350]